MTAPSPAAAPSREAEGVPASPTSDPLVTGVSEPVPGSSFPRRAAADSTHCPSRGRAGVRVSGLRPLATSSRAMHRSLCCPGIVLLLPSKHLILESGPHGKPGSSSFPPSGCLQMPADLTSFGCMQLVSQCFGLGPTNVHLQMLQHSLQQPRLPHATRPQV